MIFESECMGILCIELLFWRRGLGIDDILGLFLACLGIEGDISSSLLINFIGSFSWFFSSSRGSWRSDLGPCPEICECVTISCPHKKNSPTASILDDEIKDRNSKR